MPRTVRGATSAIIARLRERNREMIRERIRNPRPRDQMPPREGEGLGTRERIARTRRANRTAEALRRFDGGGNLDVRTSNGNRTVSNNRGTVTLTRAGQRQLRFSPNGTRRISRGDINNRQPSGGSGSNSPSGSFSPAS